MPESDQEKDKSGSPDETDVEHVKDEVLGEHVEPEESPDVEIDEDAGDKSDAVEDAPSAAKPGEKEDPDMKDMGVGPRPVDDQSAQ
ncbi:MAG: hypothetical protein M3M99_08130 [Actinomycetota bacterium]|nr:hypothetical protein [Actinomycetota bacterium]